jgi:hypothetical protein
LSLYHSGMTLKLQKGMIQVWRQVVDVAALETFFVLDKDNSSEALEVFVASVELRILLAGGGIDHGV